MTSTPVRDPNLAARLRAARQLAGFRSASLAAQRHGWPTALYRAQEAATRGVRTDDVLRFAAAFDVSVDWLMDGWPSTARDRSASRNLTMFSEDRRRENARVREAQGRRLATARVLAAFPTQTAAADYYGWSSATLSGHEAGRDGLSAAALHLYCVAFGVAAAWLQDGLPPSGLGSDVDMKLSGVTRLFRPVVEMADAKRRGDVDAVRALSLRRQKSEATRDENKKAHSGRVEIMDTPRDSRSASLIRLLCRRSEETFLLARVLSATPDLHFREQDVLVIDPAQGAPEPGRYAVCDDGHGARIFTYVDFLATEDSSFREGRRAFFSLEGVIFAVCRSV